MSVSPDPFIFQLEDTCFTVLCWFLLYNNVYSYKYTYTSYVGKKKNLLVAQLCLTLFDPMDHSLPGSSIHGILQTRILEWVAIPFSRGSSRHRDQT